MRALGEAEFRLGFGISLALRCNLQEADAQLNRTYRMTTVMLTEDHWIHAAAMFGQGVVSSVRGDLQERLARIGGLTDEGERRRREATRLRAEGKRWKEAALKMNPAIESQLSARFHFAQDEVARSCKAKWDKNDYQGF